MGIKYSDGASEDRVLRLIQQSNEIDANSPVGQESYGEWAVRYHLSPQRANLVRHLNFQGLDVLELGAGMGAVSRYLAEKSRSLAIIEGTERRFEALKSRLRDLSNWEGRVASLQDVVPEAKYDVVVVVGVLEYSELYMDSDRPFHAFLERATRFLKPGGVVVLAIENRLGLKYWNGCAEDHTGRVFDGLMGYGTKASPRTFSLAELKALFSGVGLTKQVAQFPYPDYKLPTAVVDEALIRDFPAVAADLAASGHSENYGQPQVNYFAESLVSESLSATGLLGELANSFLLVASRERGEIWQRLLSRREAGETAWHYANYRRDPICTVFRADGKLLRVEKRPLAQRPPSVYGSGSWAIKTRDTSSVVSRHPSFRSHWLRTCHYGDWDQLLEVWLHFLRWGLKDLKAHQGLAPRALDALVSNARITPTGYEWIDLEWELSQEVEPSWWIFRNVLLLGRDREHFPRPHPFSNLKELYDVLCRQLLIAPNYGRALERESLLNSWVHSNSSRLFHRSAIDRFCRRSWLPVGYPRSPRLEERIIRSLGQSFWVKGGRRVLKWSLSGYRRVRSAPERARTLLANPQSR